MRARSVRSLTEKGICDLLFGMTDEEVREYDPPRVTSGRGVFYSNNISERQSVRFAKRLIVGTEEIDEEKRNLKGSLFDILQSSK